MINMMLLKTLHIIFMTAWFAGLFYLPRLFVYHAMADDKISLNRFIIMERKLLYGIMTPSAVFTLIFGFLLTFLYLPLYFEQTWFILKIILVISLIIYHIWCVNLYKNFAKNKNKHSHIWYRWFNEVPVVMLVLIVSLVIYKPFI
jgi:protoporphyrinogen IX oxidase|tara:strand:- start:136 stop:570 length:435 start_codon:yes stop_codon:yes gene_type:complete